MAAEGGHVDIVEYFTIKGTDINSEDLLKVSIYETLLLTFIIIISDLSFTCCRIVLRTIDKHVFVTFMAIRFGFL